MRCVVLSNNLRHGLFKNCFSGIGVYLAVIDHMRDRTVFCFVLRARGYGKFVQFVTGENTPRTRQGSEMKRSLACSRDTLPGLDCKRGHRHDAGF